MLRGLLIFPANVIVVIQVSQHIQKSKHFSRDVTAGGVDGNKSSLQIKSHVTSDLQCVGNSYICAVDFLNVDTCTAYCVSMHSTAFHRHATVGYIWYRC